MSQHLQHTDLGDAVPPVRNLPRISRAAHVTRSLNTTRALADPGFSLAVLHHYAKHKMSRGRSKMQVHAKLEALELMMPHFANDFRTVRRKLDLLPSRVLPNGEVGPPPPPYMGSTCSCACTCGARRTVLDGHPYAHGLPTPPHFDVALDALDAVPMREILAGTDALSLRSSTTAPSSPDPSFTSRSTSSSVTSMNMLASASASTDALGLAPVPRRPFGLGPRFRLHSSSSMSSLNV